MAPRCLRGAGLALKGSTGPIIVPMTIVEPMYFVKRQHACKHRCAVLARSRDVRLRGESRFVSTASALAAAARRPTRRRACGLPPSEVWLERLLAVAGVGRVEVDAGLDDFVDAVEDRRIERDVGGGQLAVELLDRAWTDDC